MKQSAEKVQLKLRELGFSNKVVELPKSTRTAKEAAEAIGCEVKHIAKSIIFKLQLSERALLVVASGENRIDVKKVEQAEEENLGKADADFVKEQTGFVIGGVPPIGHSSEMVTLIDEDIVEFETIWAAAGHPRAVFQLTPDDLKQLTGGKVLDVKEKK